jgi:hypothetical protein
MDKNRLKCGKKSYFPKNNFVRTRVAVQVLECLFLYVDVQKCAQHKPYQSHFIVKYARFLALSLVFVVVICNLKL